MQYTYILGIDVSKATLDLALSTNQANAPIVNRRFDNNLAGYRALLAWLKEEKINLKHLLICLENTGIYHRSLAAFFHSHHAFIWIETPVSIKWSMGLARGKSDKLDAQRICMYAFRYQDKAQAYMPKNKSLEQLADLLATREPLIDARKRLLDPIEELKAVGLQQESEMLREACQKSLVSLSQDIKAIEQALKCILENNPATQKTFQLVTSVRSIGLITATYLLVYTHNFERFDNAKQLASYAGVVPFEYSSGSSIRGKHQVHPMANKTLKAALHLCALSSIVHNNEMQLYYQRKLKQGKNKLSVINAIRNKLLHRVFACVRDQRMYAYKHVA
ncbi:MAG: IS110 family RNA-guided transposase [Candidatus Amoebophilus sp.]